MVGFDGSTVEVDTGKPRLRNGHMGTKQLRIVCKHCNEGWMNELEQDAFQIIEPLINGASSTVTISDVKKILGISAIIFTMIDRVHMPTSGIGCEERQYIYRHRTVPPSWDIFVGRIKAYDWEMRYRHHGLRLVDPMQYGPTKPLYNAQICTLGLGSLLIQAASGKKDKIIADPVGYANHNNLVCVSAESKNFDFLSLKRLRVDAINLLADGIALAGFSMAIAQSAGEIDFKVV